MFEVRASMGMLGHVFHDIGFPKLYQKLSKGRVNSYSIENGSADVKILFKKIGPRCVQVRLTSCTSYFRLVVIL